jgi:hypothetical protein
MKYREPVLPSDVQKEKDPEGNDAEPMEGDVEATMGADAQDKLASVRKRVLANIEQAQKRQKLHYDKRSGVTKVCVCSLSNLSVVKRGYFSFPPDPTSRNKSFEEKL